MARQPLLQTDTVHWLNNKALRMCSPAARGLWQDMRCLMFNSERFGVLVQNGKAVTAEQLANLVGSTHADVKRWLGEISDAGVCMVEASTAAYYDRDLVIEGGVRAARSKAAKARHQISGFGAGGDKGGEIFTEPERGERKGGSGENHRGVAVTKTDAKPTRVPDPFEIDQEDTAKLKAAGASDDFLAWHTEKFVNYWRGVPGKKGTKLDWRATWRNWMMTELERTNGPKGHGGQRSGGVPAGGGKHDPYSADAIAERKGRR